MKMNRTKKKYIKHKKNIQVNKYCLILLNAETDAVVAIIIVI